MFLLFRFNSRLTVGVNGTKTMLVVRMYVILIE